MTAPIIIDKLPPQAKYAVFYVRENAQVPAQLGQFKPIPSFHGVALPTGADKYTWVVWFASLAPGGAGWDWGSNKPTNGSSVIWRNLQVCGDHAGGIVISSGQVLISDCGSGYSTGKVVGNYTVGGYTNLNPLVWHFAGVSRDGSSVVAVLDGVVVGRQSNLGTYSYTGTDSWLFGADLGNWSNVAIAYIAIYDKALSLDDLIAIYNGARIPGAVGEYIGDNYDPTTGIWHDSSGHGNDANPFCGSANCGCSSSGCNCSTCSSPTQLPYKVQITTLPLLALPPIPWFPWFWVGVGAATAVAVGAGLWIAHSKGLI